MSIKNANESLKVI